MELDGINGTDGIDGINGTDGLSPINDTALQCEECIKYWSHTLNQGQFRDFINDLTEYINSINFDYATLRKSTR